MPPKTRLKADKHTADITSLVQRTWFALVKKVISYVFSVRNYCSHLVSTFRLFIGRTYCWKCIQPRSAFFAIHNNFAQRPCFGCCCCPFCIVYVTEHGWDTALELIGHNMRLSTTLKWSWWGEGRNTWTASWDWTAFQTASADQKWAEMEDKWQNNSGHQNRKLPPKK